MSSSIYRMAKSMLIILLSAGWLASVNASEMPATAVAVEGTAKADSLKECVRPTDWMRRNHMELIKHSRDDVVHKGIRIRDNSLAGCVDCHSRKDADNHPVPVNAQGEFCSSCHAYVGETLNCFGCHSTVPTAEK